MRKSLLAIFAISAFSFLAQESTDSLFTSAFQNERRCTNGYSTKPSHYIKLYSNLKQIDQDMVPGMVQLDGLFNWPLWGYCINKNRKRVSTPKLYIFDNLIFPHIQFNRFDESTSFVAPLYQITNQSADQKKLVNYFDLYQYSYFKSHFKVNLITAALKKSVFRVDPVFSFHRSYVTSFADSTKKLSVSSCAYGISVFWQTKYDSVKSKFNVSAGLSYFGIFLLDSRLKTAYGNREAELTTDPTLFSRTEEEIKPSNERMQPILAGFVEIDYLGKYWIRMNQFNNYLYFKTRGEKYINSFFQIQFGVKIPVNELAALFSVNKGEQK